MALTDPYVDLETLKARANITGTAKDTVLAQVALEASRQIERWTGRIFNQSAAGTVRYFTAKSPRTLFIDDLVSISGLSIDDGNRTYNTTWSATDYDLGPDNAAELGRPYTEIRMAPAGRFGFYRATKGVRVTGVWGWPTVPDDIVGAVILQALRLWKRQEAPFGITGSAELGQMRSITSMDPDVKALIAPYKKVVF